MTVSDKYLARLESAFNEWQANNQSNPGDAIAKAGPACLSNYSRANERAGYYYFSPGATDFFSARYSEFVYSKTAIFVDSVRDTYSCGAREYRVNHFSPDAQVWKLAEFSTKASADRFASRLDAYITERA